MAVKRTEALKVIRRFIKEADKHFAVKKAILFGSRNNGRKREFSDIDLAVISDSFHGMSHFNRLVALGKIAWKTKTTEIEALGFTEKEYENASDIELLGEIKKTGSIVYEKRPVYKKQRGK